MRTFYCILALISVGLGFVCFLHGDQDTFRFCVILGMLFNVYALQVDNL